MIRPRYSCEISGFTLIELVIVIVIIAILSGTVYLMWPGQKANLHGVANQLASDLRYMQNLAMTRNQRYCINFSSSQYTLTGSDCITAVNHPSTNTNVVVMPTGISLSSTESSIVFDSKGRPYNGSGVVLSTAQTVTFSAGSDSVVMTIVPETGKITVA